MALTSNGIVGKTVILSISTDLTTPAYKAVVCSSDDITLSGGTEAATTIVTRCGTAKTAGTPSYSLNFAGLHNSLVTAASELSGNELAALKASGASFLWKMAGAVPADFYRQGTGVLGTYDETAPMDGFARFSGTIEVSGVVDLTL